MEKLNFEWHDSRNGGEYRAEAAAESLSYIRKERRERRLAKLKDLIRARVPLAARAAILEGFPL